MADRSIVQFLEFGILDFGIFNLQPTTYNIQHSTYNPQHVPQLPLLPLPPLRHHSPHRLSDTSCRLQRTSHGTHRHQYRNGHL